MSDVKFKGSDRLEIEHGCLRIYLVWTFDPDRRGFSLESVSLSGKHAAYAKAVAKGKGLKVVVEKRIAEHLFGGTLGIQSGEEPPDGYEGDEVGPLEVIDE